MTQLTRGLGASVVGNGGPLLPGKSIPYPSRWSVGGSRTQVLYNRGEFFLSILPNGTIKSSMDKSNIFVVLQLYTVAASVVAIQARMTGYFLCMNYLSRLYTSKNYTGDCAFYEDLLEQHYTTFYSNRYKKERNQTWYISIDRQGRPRKGARSNVHQLRVQFLPMEADLDLIKQIEHQQRTKTGSNTSATTSIDAIRTVQPLPSSGVTTPGPPPLPDTPRCSGPQCERRRRRCKKKRKGRKAKRKCKERRRKRRRRRRRRKKKHHGGPVVKPTRLQTPDASVVNLGRGGGAGGRENVREGEDVGGGGGGGGGGNTAPPFPFPTVSLE